MLTFDDLLTGFDQTGIQDNDLVMVHTSYKSLGGVEGGAETLVDAIHELTIPRGGAVFWPTYTVDAWCNRRYFDHDETPGEMGVVPEVARLKDGARRTRHPIHNFAIHGRWRYDFLFDNQESFSPQGPYGLFHRDNGLVISIGVPWNDTISFVHYVEQAAGAYFRRVKRFAGIYVSGFNEPPVRTFEMSVRKTKDHITHVAPLYDDWLVPGGVVKQVKVGKAVVSYFRCQDYFDAVFPLVQSRPDLFHYVHKWEPPAPLTEPSSFQFDAGYYPDGEPVRDVQAKVAAAWKSEFMTAAERDEWERVAEGYIEHARKRAEVSDDA